MRERGYSPACRLRVRHRIHKSVLGVLLEHCTGVVNAPEIELQSDYGKAARYVVNHFDSLSVFLENGEIEMDNNGIEHSIRPLAIGRKNWLHVGHIEAGDRAAVLYSIFATCERLGVNPRDYLLHVFSKLPTQDPNRMHELTPRAWRDSQATRPG